MKTFILIIASLSFLQSCSKNSNSVAQKTLTVNSYHDLPKCNSDFKLIRAVVTSENKTYICSENEWQDDFL